MGGWEGTPKRNSGTSRSDGWSSKEKDELMAKFIPQLEYVPIYYKIATTVKWYNIEKRLSSWDY